MGFAAGKPKTVRVQFKIRPKAVNAAARKKELKKFYGEVRKLAKKFKGSETHTR
jgi:hypothetical protein